MYYNTRHIAPSVVHLATSRDSVVAHETTDDDEVCKLYIILVYFVAHISLTMKRLETVGNICAAKHMVPSRFLPERERTGRGSGEG